MGKKKTTLPKWCERYGRGAKAYLAKECEMRWASIHDIVRGASTPTVDTAKKIETATGGEVAWTSLV